MVAARRARANFALQHAVARARQRGVPLLVLEALRCGYPYASDRVHRFVLDGMRDNARDFAQRGVAYYPYLEPRPGAGQGLLAALARRACSVVTDEFPATFVPRMVERAAGALDVELEVVDSCGLLPLRATPGEFATALAFRRFLQRELPGHLRDVPRPDPAADARLPALAALPGEIESRWPRTDTAWLARGSQALDALPIDHAIAPAPIAGGSAAARRATARFVARGLAHYAERRRTLEDAATSGLSPYLHFGHIGAHEVFAAIARREGWSLRELAGTAHGRRQGWWAMSPGAEAFLDQLVTWRELGYAFAWHRRDHAAYESLPGWALDTLARHARDPREREYSLDDLAAARTHDELWNAAQGELARTGRIHGYLRMLWGKRVLTWSRTPRDAFERLVALNDRFALDGRDPNSYAGIAWCFGRFDHPWPERAVFGTVRCMTSESTRRKLDVAGYVARFTGAAVLPPRTPRPRSRPASAGR
jgi:deoxyribodipyrimidine photo-lyase